MALFPGQPWKNSLYCVFAYCSNNGSRVASVCEFRMSKDEWTLLEWLDVRVQSILINQTWVKSESDLVMVKHHLNWTSNELKLHFSNIEQTRTCSSISDQTREPYFASNKRTSNIEPNRAFTRFIELLIEQTRTMYIWTSNKLERIHLLVIELFLASNFQHPTYM